MSTLVEFRIYNVQGPRSNTSRQYRDVFINPEYIVTLREMRNGDTELAMTNGENLHIESGFNDVARRLGCDLKRMGTATVA